MAVSKELTSNDYKILKYINRFPDIKKDNIILHFSNISSIEYRLDFLISNEYLAYIDEYIPVTITYHQSDKYSLPIHMDKIQITDKGRKKLEDYSQKQKEKYLREIIALAGSLGAIATIISAVKEYFD